MQRGGLRLGLVLLLPLVAVGCGKSSPPTEGEKSGSQSASRTDPDAANATAAKQSRRPGEPVVGQQSKATHVFKVASVEASIKEGVLRADIKFTLRGQAGHVVVAVDDKQKMRMPVESTASTFMFQDEGFSPGSHSLKVWLEDDDGKSPVFGPLSL